MHKITGLPAKGLLGKCQHLDPTSEHAARDYEENANGYRLVRKFLNPTIREVRKGAFRLQGGQDWLAGFGPIHDVSMADGMPFTLKDFVHFCQKGVRDKYGRSRACVAYRGIIAPPDPLQMALRDMCLRAPHFAEAYFREAFAWLKTRLHKEFPAVPVQLAFHTYPGRAHWEWVSPKYALNGRVARLGVKWDGDFWSAGHAISLMRRGMAADGTPPKLNSDIELDFARYLIISYRQVMRRSGVRSHTFFDVFKAEQFFLRLQEASLRDGMKSRRLQRARAAERELVWNLGRQRALRVRTTAHAKQFISSQKQRSLPENVKATIQPNSRSTNPHRVKRR